jgi:hypothetical protein
MEFQKLRQELSEEQDDEEDADDYLVSWKQKEDLDEPVTF